MMKYWLVKQEPKCYPWAQFVHDGHTAWTGVRNFQARNNLRTMRRNDRVFYYHSVTGKCIVGLARVTRGAYGDPTDETGTWSCVDLEPIRSCREPVTLEQIKNAPGLDHLALLRQSRLSVMPVSTEEANLLCKMGGLE